MSTQLGMVGLTAREFFARALPGCSLSDAHVGTRIAYSTIFDLSKERCESRRSTLERLQKWSLTAGAPHGVYISAAKTAGLSEPTEATGTEG